MRTAVFEAFMDRYFPRQTPAQIAPPADAKEHAAAVAGNYEASRRADQNLFSFLYMFGQIAGDRCDDDGSLVVGGLDGLNGEPKKFREVQPWLWQEVARRAAHRRQRATSRARRQPRAGRLRSDHRLQRPPAWRNKAWLLPAILVAGASLCWRC